MKLVFATLLLASLSGNLYAQEDVADNIETSDTAKKKKVISIGTDGIYVGNEKKDTTDKAVEVQFGMVDLGINYLDDKTDYSDPQTQNFLRVNNDMKNESLFSLREGKSINVNVWPVLLKCRLQKSERQRVYLTTGVGLQMYNFRFNKRILYTNETNPYLDTTSLHLSKNKLGFTYVSVPLQLTFKTKLFDTKDADDLWLVYGFGVTGGYRISSWTKTISEENGKQKNHDPFNFADFNACVTAEFGVDGYFRLFGSYQLTALHDYALVQHPYTIGIRLLGI